MSTKVRRGQEPASGRMQSVLLGRGIATAKALRAGGVHPELIRRSAATGKILRLARGIYGLPARETGAGIDLARVAARMPNGVVCLLSALQFHGLTTQLPARVWVAIDVKAWKPVTGLPVRFVRFSGPALTEGVETHEVEGVPVKVYSVAKTVADCFKYRNKIGLDVALEALREAKRARRFNTDELWRFAKVDRVANVMRPYLEALA